jgi:hypothetical protein
MPLRVEAGFHPEARHSVLAASLAIVGRKRLGNALPF